MRSFSRVPLSSRWAWTSSRKQDKGSVMMVKWSAMHGKNIKERKRELFLTNLTSHFYCEIVGSGVACEGQKKTRGYVHILFFSVSRRKASEREVRRPLPESGGSRGTFTSRGPSNEKPKRLWNRLNFKPLVARLACSKINGSGYSLSFSLVPSRRPKTKKK